MTTLQRETLLPGVSFSVLHDPKFKHNRLSVNLTTPLRQESVSQNALLPALLRRGCKSCPDFTELNRRLDNLYGASLSADVLKSGANQIVNLSITAVDDRFTISQEALAAECAELIAQILFEPKIENGEFPADEVELEKKNMIDAIEAEINDKRSYAVLRCRRLMGRGDNASIPKYGTVEQAQALTAAQAAEAYDALLHNASVEIMFTGSGNADAAVAILSKAFEGKIDAPASYQMPEIVEQAGKVQEVTDRMEVAQSKLVLGFRTGARGNAAEQAAMRLMVALYGGTPSSKLFVNVREKLSLCYYCAARYDRLSGIMMVDCGVENKNVQPAKEEILRQLTDIQNGIFEDETLENTRLMLKNALRAIGDSTGALEDWYLNRILSDNITSPEQEMELFDAVTREDVIEAARKITLDTVYLLTGKGEESNA